MSTKLLILILIFTLNFETNAQNLVPNPSFETYTDCPTVASNIIEAYPWVSASEGTPDFFHACNGPCTGSQVCVPDNVAGYQQPNSGEGYAGVFTYIDAEYREYIQSPLTEELEAGIDYEVSFYVNFADGVSLNPTGIIGAYLSVGSVFENSEFNMNYYPQIYSTGVVTDTENWVLISGTYTALGGEQFITIGHFANDQNAVFVNPGNESWFSYHYIDDVSVINLNPEPADTVTVTPIDSIQFTTAILLEMPNVFTPNMDGNNDLFIPVSASGIISTDLVIVNRWGEAVYQGDALLNGWNGKFNGNSCVEGTYFWKINYTDVKGKEEIQQGFVVLSR